MYILTWPGNLAVRIQNWVVISEKMSDYKVDLPTWNLIILSWVSELFLGWGVGAIFFSSYGDWQVIAQWFDHGLLVSGHKHVYLQAFRVAKPLKPVY